MRLTYDATTDVAYLSLRAVRLAEPLGPTLLVQPDGNNPDRLRADRLESTEQANNVHAAPLPGQRSTIETRYTAVV